MAEHMTAHERAHDEPTAIRHPKRGKAHRPVPLRTTVWSQAKYRRGGYEAPACAPYAVADLADMTERVPLSQTAPEDRCRTCWPTTKETR